jgi:hypothetical protein
VWYRWPFIRLIFAYLYFPRKSPFCCARARLFLLENFVGVNQARVSLLARSVSVNEMRLWTISEKWKSRRTLESIKNLFRMSNEVLEK